MSDSPAPGPWEEERDRLAAALMDLAELRRPATAAFGSMLPGHYLETIDWDGDARKEPSAASAEPTGFDSLFVDPDEQPPTTASVAVPPVVNTETVLNEFNWE